MRPATEAARAFVQGAIEGLTPAPEFYVVRPIPGPGIGSYERAAHCASEIGRQRMEALDATLARIKASNDIRQFIDAAE